MIRSQPSNIILKSQIDLNFPGRAECKMLHIMEISPDEIFAVTAEGWMFEEPGDELVILHK